MKQSILTKPPVRALLALVSCALWGSAFSSVKEGYAMLGIGSEDWASQLLFAGIRFVLAGIMALAAGSLRAGHLLLPQRQTLPKIGIISLFQTVIQYFCYYIGLAHTSGVKASVLVGTNVFLAIIISTLLMRLERMTLRKAAGSVIGFLGIVAVNLGGLSGGLSFSLLGDGMILLCTAASGFSSAFMKKLSSGEDPVLLSGWQFLLGGAVLAAIGLLGGGRLGSMSPGAWLLLCYLAFVSAAAYSVWAMLLKANPVSKVAVFGFLNPICGVVISAIVLHEAGQINLRFLLALVLVCIGIITVNTEKVKTMPRSVL